MAQRDEQSGECAFRIGVIVLLVLLGVYFAYRLATRESCRFDGGANNALAADMYNGVRF